MSESLRLKGYGRGLCYEVNLLEQLETKMVISLTWIVLLGGQLVLLRVQLQGVAEVVALVSLKIIHVIILLQNIIFFRIILTEWKIGHYKTLA